LNGIAVNVVAPDASAPAADFSGQTARLAVLLHSGSSGRNEFDCFSVVIRAEKSTKIPHMLHFLDLDRFGDLNKHVYQTFSFDLDHETQNS